MEGGAPPGVPARVPYRPLRRLRAWAFDAGLFALVYASALTFVPLFGVAGALARSAPGSSAYHLSLPLRIPGLAAYGPDVPAHPGAALLVVIFVVLFGAYHALFEGTLGTTPGQSRENLAPRPVGRVGKIGLRRAFLRAAARPLDGLLFGAAGALVALASGGRRIGDLIGGTVLDDARNHMPLARASSRPDGPEADTAAVARAKRAAGERGERELRHALAPMASEGCAVFFGVDHRAFGDVDALVVCPAGVFVLDAKSHRGTITHDAATGALLRDGEPFPEDVRLSLLRQARHVEATLFAGRPGPLYALMCFTRASLGGQEAGAPPDAVTLDSLPRLLRAATPRLDGPTIDSLARGVEDAYGALRHAA